MSEKEEKFWKELSQELLKIPTKTKIPLFIARGVDTPSPPVGVGKVLFGLPVVEIGSQGAVFRGQYVSHAEFVDEQGDEVWVIRLGLFSIMAVFVDPHTESRVYYPFAEIGFLTATAPRIIDWIYRGYDDWGRKFAYFECVGNFKLDYIECYKSDILYLDLITQGKFPLIIVDKYKILRSLPPSQFVEEYASLYYAVRELQRQNARLQRENRRLRTVAIIRESEYVTLKREIDDLLPIIRTLMRENERLREELERREVRERFREVNVELYRSLVESLERVLPECQDLLDRVASIRRRLEEIAKPPEILPRPPEEKEEKREEKKEEVEKGEGASERLGRFLRLGR